MLNDTRQIADEFCSCRQLENTILGTVGKQEILDMLGFWEQDIRWCTPWGVDVTYLCEISDIGGFGSSKWSIDGWILDASSMQALKEEFPDEFPERPEHR